MQFGVEFQSFFCLLRSLVYSVCSQLLEKVMAQSVRRNVCPFLMHHKMVVCAAKEDKLHPNPPLLTTLFHRLIYPLVNVFPGYLNLIKTFQIEVKIALITKSALIFKSTYYMTKYSCQKVPKLGI